MTQDAPGPATATPRSFTDRLVGALKLDPAVYDEIEHDPTAMGQSVAVVALGALARACRQPTAASGSWSWA